MGKSNLSILGLYYAKPTIFDGMSLPEGLSRQDTIDNILLECAELEILYTDPDFMATAVAIWSRAQLPSWEKLYATTNFDYNPIWNKDGEITETETRDLQSFAQDQPGVTTVSKNEVAAYDANTPQLANQNTINMFGANQSNGTDTGTITRFRTEKGNIGITTTQQMIKEEREVAAFNIISAIAKDFKQKFCLMVY